MPAEFMPTASTKEEPRKAAIPIQAVETYTVTETKQSLGMLSAMINRSKVAACMEMQRIALFCYEYQAQRLNIAPETC